MRGDRFLWEMGQIDTRVVKEEKTKDSFDKKTVTVEHLNDMCYFVPMFLKNDDYVFNKKVFDDTLDDKVKYINVYYSNQGLRQICPDDNVRSDRIIKPTDVMANCELYPGIQSFESTGMRIDVGGGGIKTWYSRGRIWEVLYKRLTKLLCLGGGSWDVVNYNTVGVNYGVGEQGQKQSRKAYLWGVWVST